MVLLLFSMPPVLSIEPLQNWLFVFDSSPELYENGGCILFERTL